MMRHFYLVALFFLSFHFSGFGQSIWYVKSGAAGANNGSSWTNAFTSLQSALDAAQPGDQVWVAAGIYFPEKLLDNASSDQRFRSFLLPAGVRLYGGFAGSEPPETDLTLRDFGLNQAILSGDIDNNDTRNQGISTVINGENAYHVVVAEGLQAPAVFDGFTITGGSADGTVNISIGPEIIYSDRGGGFHCANSDFAVANLVVDGNRSALNGGGIYCVNSTVQFTNLSVLNNLALSGGGISSIDGHLVFRQLKLVYNSATTHGGGWSAQDGDALFVNVDIRHNTAAHTGGAGHSVSCETIIINGLVADNFSVLEGGGWVQFWVGFKIINTTFTNNRSDYGIGAMYTTGTLYIENSIVFNNPGFPEDGEVLALDSSFRNSVIHNDFFDNAGILIPGFVTGPLFRDASAEDYSLSYTSVAINAGNNSLYFAEGSNAPGFDGAGTTRVLANTIDLGAYECPVMPDANGILYVSAIASPGKESGHSWVNPLKDLADALAFANRIRNSSPGYIKEIWVAAGTYRPKYKPAEKDLLGAPTTDRDKTFLLVRNVPIYGGFAGTTGTEGNRDARDWNANATILDGDIDLDGTYANNVYHVALVVGGNSNTILDGFVIQNGNADGPPSSQISVDGFILIYRSNGGGLFIGDGSPTIRNLRITNNRAVRGGGANSILAGPRLSGIIFEDNLASLNGGGMHNQVGIPLVTNCSFFNNVAQQHGGGWHNSSGNTIIRSSTFTSNRAVDGAGWYNETGETEMDSLLFSQNITMPTGPVSGDGFGAGIYIRTTSITVTNTRFLQNAARRGAGIYNFQSNSQLYNLSFAGNEGTMSAGGIENWEGSPVLVNCLFTGNRGAYGAGINNSFGNPLLVHVTCYGNSADWGGAVNNNIGNFTVKNSVVRGNFANLGGMEVNGSVLYYFSLIGDTYYLHNNGVSEPVSLDDTELFINPRPAAEAPTVEGNYRLRTNAWIINHGDPEVFLPIHNPDVSHLQFDLAGSPRIVGATDLGAYEFDAAALPVRLLHFRAEWQGQQVQLSWATAMEQQNDRFEIEHSTDGENFSLLHTENGAGDANTPRHYVTFHRNPPAGLNYYRLKQFDLDGRMHIVGVRLVNVQAAIANTVRLYPNPAPGFFQLALPPISGKINLQLINANGAVVHREALQINGGPSVITINPPKKLPAGWYNVQLTGEKINSTIRLLIK